MKRYSETFKTKMLEKMLGPGARSANALSRETGVSVSTLTSWRRAAVGGNVGKNTSEQSAVPALRRTSDEKIRLVFESGGLSDEDLGGFLRREALHEADLVALRENVRDAAVQGYKPAPRGKSPEQKQIEALQKELNRKEKALAETAALLVLRGKLQAFLSGDEEGGTSGRQG